MHHFKSMMLQSETFMANAYVCSTKKAWSLLRSHKPMLFVSLRASFLFYPSHCHQALVSIYLSSVQSSPCLLVWFCQGLGWGRLLLSDPFVGWQKALLTTLKRHRYVKYIFLIHKGYRDGYFCKGVILRLISIERSSRNHSHFLKSP